MINERSFIIDALPAIPLGMAKGRSTLSMAGLYRAGRDRPLPWTIRVLPACLACQALPT
jgi:hypothetical protein